MRSEHVSCAYVTVNLRVTFFKIDVSVNFDN